MTTSTNLLTEDEKSFVRSNAQYVLSAIPMNLEKAYEIFERFCELSGIDASEYEECEAIFDDYADYYGLVENGKYSQLYKWEKIYFKKEEN